MITATKVNKYKVTIDCYIKSFVSAAIGIRIDSGDVDPHSVLETPVLDNSWLKRWRRFYHVAYRTVNLRLKCSREMLLRRLLALWSNALRR